MNPIHLLWIIPLSAGIGAFFMGILAGGTESIYPLNKGEEEP